MTKIKVPLLSLKATGGLGKLFSLAKRQGRHIIERRPIPTDPKSSSQLFSRLMFTKCVDLWHLLSDSDKQDWETAARPKHMTGYAWYISQCLRPNPGIYLPLIGGTMSGDIDMATNRILNLPDPTVNQEPDTRAARITAILAHIAVAAAHHAPFTAPNHTAIDNGAPHHARYADVEAVTAAKTVKLDDFATPDDNTDLNASQTRHGLFKKLDGVVTHFLNGLGNWVAVPIAKYLHLRTQDFQLYAGTGDATNPQKLNDNNTTTQAEFTLNEYAIIDLRSLFKITQWRHFGDAFNNGNGVWKIEYLDEENAWHDWVTGISTRKAESWTNWTTETEVFTRAIRLTCTTKDSAGLSVINELEVKY